MTRQTRRGEGGYMTLTVATITTVFALAVIVVFLENVQTSLLAVRNAGRSMATLECADAGAAYALWRLQYDDDFVDALELEEPDSEDVPCADEVVEVTVTQKTIPVNLPAYLEPYAYADIVFVVDISASVSSSEMSSFRQAANALVDGFDLPANGDRYRIGMSKFARSSQPMVSVTDSADALHSAINGLTSTSLLTCLSSHYVYAVRGGATTTFWRYDISGNSWTARAATPNAIGDGGALAYDGTSVYALRGAGTTTLYQHSTLANSWSTKAAAPGSVGTGGALLYAGTYLYALQGNNATGFYRFDRLANAWASMATTPAAVGAGGVGGGALASDGTYIYALRGANTDTFWRYDFITNSWSALAATPTAMGDGAALVYNGTSIYAVRGNDSTAFYRYNIASNTWTTLAAMPSAIGTGGAAGGSLTFDGTYVYALRGTSQATYWRYNVGTNAWTAMTAAPGTVSDGGSLTYYAGQYDIACQTNLVVGLDGGAAQYATGLGDRPDIPNLMVFLTDGDDSAGNSLATIGDTSTATGARIFAVGIDEVALSSLNAIASEPDDEHVFYAADFEALLDLIEDIVAAVTQGAIAGTLYDIEAVAADGTTVHVRALLTLDGEVIIVSWQVV